MTPAPARPPASPVLRARSLVKTYGSGDTAVHALRDVDLDVRAGEFVVLLGASGSGKSTLLNILGGLDRPTSGRGAVTATTTSPMRPTSELTRYRREHVGFVFQFYNLIPSLTARENVALVTDIAGDPMRRGRGAGAGRAAARGATTSRRSCPAASSSAWPSPAPSPSARDVLLCDEPTGALDYATGMLVLEVIARINRELGTTAVVITHNAAIAGMADRVIRLSDGRIASVEVPERRLTPAELSW